MTVVLCILALLFFCASWSMSKDIEELRKENQTLKMRNGQLESCNKCDYIKVTYRG
jgi:cell division protein FtsB